MGRTISLRINCDNSEASSFNGGIIAHPRPEFHGAETRDETRVLWRVVAASIAMILWIIQLSQLS